MRFVAPRGWHGRPPVHRARILSTVGVDKFGRIARK
jgi:hypothetical protein